MRVLLAVLLLDGALLGSAAGVAGMVMPTHRSWRQPVTRRGEAGEAWRGEMDVVRRDEAGEARRGKEEVVKQNDAGVGRQGKADVAAQAGLPGRSRQLQPDQSSRPMEARQIALTFDDGPHEIYTERLLDGLKKRGVPATFFLMGESIEGKETLVRRMQEEGHLIGNHSFRHIQLTHAGEEVVCQAVEETEQIIEDITGARPLYLRPPYGDWNESLECRMDLTTVFWTVDSLDWKLKNTSRIVRRVVKEAEDGDIVLMHDIFSTSVEAALQIVDQLQAEGFQFVTVDALLIE